MIDAKLDRWFGIVVSVGIHVSLLLGTMLVAIEHFVDSGSRGFGFACSIREDAERASDELRTNSSIDEPSDSPVTLIAQELASIFERRERCSGCPACAAERRTGRVVVPRGIGPQGLCCRHVILMEDARGGAPGDP